MRIQFRLRGVALASMAVATLGCGADGGVVSTEPVDVPEQVVDVAVSADAATGLVDTMSTDAASIDTSTSDEAQTDIVTPPDAGVSESDEPDTSPEDDGFGAPCDDDDDCPSGICVEHMGEELCTTLCDTDCPPGWSCEQVAIQGGDPIAVCVSSFEHLCRPCMTESDCTSETSVAACRDYGGQGMFCGATCDDDIDCPEGFMCQESTSSRDGASRQCVDIDGVCECSKMASELELSTSCSILNKFSSTNPSSTQLLPRPWAKGKPQSAPTPSSGGRKAVLWISPNTAASTSRSPSWCTNTVLGTGW